MERVPPVEFGKQGKVSVSGKQEFNAVGETDRRNPSVVHDGSPHSRPLNQDTQDLQKIACLTEKPIAWRCRPGFELLPGKLRRSGCLPPYSVIRHDAQRLVTTRPGDCPNPVSFTQHPQDLKTSLMQS